MLTKKTQMIETKAFSSTYNFKKIAIIVPIKILLNEQYVILMFQWFTEGST